MLLEAFAVFLGGFLLFQIQPIIGTAILPWFGGTAAVWSTCMLFFQTALLLGYAYAHALVRWFPPRRQILVHMLLLGVSLVALPVTPDVAWKPLGTEEPVTRILGLLATTVGLPYTLLATTGPVVQSWLVRRDPSARPYRLFALGNLASLAALLGYPFVLQPVLALGEQLQWWSVLYGVYVVLCIGLVLRARGSIDVPTTAPSPDAAADDPPPAGRRRALWVALAAVPSILLLAITNHLTKDVAPVPFLWVLPLSIYLFSFVACFEHDRWYRRRIYLPLLLVAFCAIEVGTSHYAALIGLIPSTILHASAFWICCMVCHGELASLRPSPRHLTAFYLMVAVGGALGGVFVGVLAPYVFHSYLELPIGLAGALLLSVVILYRETPPDRRHSGRVVLGAVAGILLVYLGAKTWAAQSGAILTTRNFFGVLRVLDVDDEAGRRRVLAHGVINHGEQFLDPARRREATSYYTRGSGAQIVFERLERRGPIRAGVLGLGAGVLAVYGRAGDQMRFYEINPLVVELARTEFTLLADCPAATEVLVGDGRLLLEREAPQAFDVLVLDAFSGDSVPVHLLTREAFGLYVQHLSPTGVLLVNVSNRYLDLEPVIRASAHEWNREVVVISSPENLSIGAAKADWMVVSGDAALLDDLRSTAGGRAPNPQAVRLWTDDYVNLLQVLR